MKLFIPLTLIMILLSVGAYTQSRQIHGLITDAEGNPLGGASVTLKNSPLGTAADASGNYTIIATTGQHLIISATGFLDQDVTIKSSDEVNVVLQRGNNVMQEVVVTALGQTTQKRKLGYSTQTFSTETLNRTANVGALDALAGLQGAANIAPSFDDGYTVYQSLLGSIDSALNQPLVTGKTDNSDIIFGGDITKWQAFANTLELKLYLRMVNAKP